MQLALHIISLTKFLIRFFLRPYQNAINRRNKKRADTLNPIWRGAGDSLRGCSIVLIKHFLCAKHDYKMNGLVHFLREIYYPDRLLGSGKIESFALHEYDINGSRSVMDLLDFG